MTLNEKIYTYKNREFLVNYNRGSSSWHDSLVVRLKDRPSIHQNIDHVQHLLNGATFLTLRHLVIRCCRQILRDWRVDEASRKRKGADEKFLDELPDA